MEIEIITSSGKKIAKNAWTLSRHEDGATIESISKIDAPVNDFPSVVLHINSTIIEREVFSSMRDHVIWARTSRVDEIRNFEVDKIFSIHSETHEYLRKTMRGMDRQDEYRMLLPLVALTNYTIRISYRSLVKVKDYFGSLSGNTGHISAELFRKAEMELTTVLSKLDFGEVKYKEINIFPGILNTGTGMIGDVFTFTMAVPFALRAQIVRARLLSVTDNMINSLITELPYATQGTIMTVQVSGTRETWKTLLSKRSCWLAQADLWASIVRKVSDAYGFHEDILPCSDGTCPYASDAELRLTDKDPGAPCPVFCIDEESQIVKSEAIKFVPQMREQVLYENRSRFWEEKIKIIEEVS